jgi:hypothetical protein
MQYLRKCREIANSTLIKLKGMAKETILVKKNRTKNTKKGLLRIRLNKIGLKNRYKTKTRHVCKRVAKQDRFAKEHIENNWRHLPHRNKRDKVNLRKQN